MFGANVTYIKKYKYDPKLYLHTSIIIYFNLKLHKLYFTHLSCYCKQHHSNVCVYRKTMTEIIILIRRNINLL